MTFRGRGGARSAAGCRFGRARGVFRRADAGRGGWLAARRRRDLAPPPPRWASAQGAWRRRPVHDPL